MARLILKLQAFIIQIIYKHTIILLIFLLCIGVSVALINMSNLSLSLIESQALQNSVLSVEALKKSHSLYSEEVIERAKVVPDINISHDYLNQKNTIPPPATYTIELGKRLSNNQTGYLVRLFSDYPFPHRQLTGGVKDNFEQEALDYLRQNPDQAFFRQENYQNRLSFRYAEAMIMKPSCISCHNSHPNSPKRDWQIGDVRGIVEIAQPLDKFIAQTRIGLQSILAMLGGISVLGIFGVTVVIARLRHTTRELEAKVRERTADLKLLATFDDLTQVANRRHLNEFLNQEWQKMAHTHQPLSLILCDIDYFKLYNDRYGHLAGDRCLIEVTQAIKSSLFSAQDFLARYGGEEFIVVLPNQSIKTANNVAESIRQSVLNTQIIHEDSPINSYVSLSLGISSMIPSALQAPDILINTADQALYLAKKNGRNCCVVKTVDY